VKLIFVWFLNALALLLVTHFISDIHVANFTTALLAALVIGLVNMLIKPILIILTLPITILTLGLFILVINGLLFYWVGNWIQGFEVKTLVAGIIGALSYSVLSWLFAAIVIDVRK
jgi:putative membrane protein